MSRVEEIRSGMDGDTVVLLVGRGTYFELIGKSGDDLLLQSHNQIMDSTVAECSDLSPVMAVKVVKGNGSVIYAEKAAKHQRWFIRGKIVNAEPKKVHKEKHAAVLLDTGGLAGVEPADGTGGPAEG